MMNRFIIKTLGCKVNQSESESMAASLRREGFLEATADSGENGAGCGEDRVSVCIVNTCTVTEKASMQSRQAIRQAIRAYPDARIIVTGCYAQTQPEEIKKIKGVSIILPQENKQTVAASILPQVPEAAASGTGPWPDAISFSPEETRGRRTRAFLKIQDGCNAHCTYCIVPKARGKSRSMPESQVISNLRGLRRAGYLEVVLSGIHLGCWGLDFSPPSSLHVLLERIEALDIVPRIRLSSIEPGELSGEIIDLVAGSDSFCRHFHIPLQSGDDGMLRKMGRHYSRSFFMDLIGRIHEKIPDAAIGVDVLVGFPGETDEAFENTIDLIDSLPLSYLHVFPFSPRKSTPAYGMPDKVPIPVLKSRAAQMRKIGENKRKAFHEILVGQTVEVLVEGQCDNASGLFRGRTSNYVPVYLKSRLQGGNVFVKANVEKSFGNKGVLAVLTSSPDGL